MKTTKILTALMMSAHCLMGCSKSDDKATNNMSPGNFDIIGVTDGAIGVDVKPTFRWEASLDPEGDVISYDLYLGTDPNATMLLIGDLTTTSFEVNERLSLLTEYYWRVIAKDNQGNSTESATYNFTTRDLWVPNTPITASADFWARLDHTTTVFNEKLWLIGGFNTISFDDVWNSTDGVNWTLATDADRFSARSRHTTTVFDGKLWVIGGRDSNGNQNDIWSSPDGIEWTEEVASAPFTARTSHTTTVFNNKLWVIGGNDGAPKNDVWFSSDGTSWTMATASAPFSSRERHTSVVFDDRLWIIGGSNGDRKNDVWFSSDGTNWTAAGLAGFSAREGHSSVVFDNKIWVIAGWDSADSFGNDVWSSSDGNSWESASIPQPFPERWAHSSVVHNEKIWVIAGWEEDYKNDVWTLD